jgi:signal transduction histidine kinase
LIVDDKAVGAMNLLGWLLHLGVRVGRRSHPGSLSGSGIGIAIAKRRGARHGGNMWLVSEEGPGSAILPQFACSQTGEGF